MKSIILLVTLVLLCAGVTAGPRPKKWKNSNAFCPHIVRQAYGTSVGYKVKHRLKKDKRHRLPEYRNSRKRKR